MRLTFFTGALVLLIWIVSGAGLWHVYEVQAQGGYSYFFPITVQNYQLTGDVSGVVLSAADGVTPIPNAQVCVTETLNCVAADALGSYTLSEVVVGSASLTASSFGFFDRTETVVVVQDQTSAQDFLLLPSTTQGVVEVELTWDSRRDLDAHLWLPPTIPVHIYWRFLGDCGLFPYACLNKDDFAFGPEEIRIRQQFPGEYVYAVFLFDAGNIVSSSPQVSISDSNGLIAEFQVPEGGRGRWWHVFNLDGLTGNITLVNQVTSENPAPYDPSTGADVGENQDRIFIKR